MALGRRKKARTSPSRLRYTSERWWVSSRERRQARFAAFVVESRERRERHGPYAGEQRRAKRYEAWKRERGYA